MKVLAVVFFIASGASHTAFAQSTVYKCTVNGQKVYSESPCDKQAKTETLGIKDDRMGNVTYGRRVAQPVKKYQPPTEEQKEQKAAAEKKKNVCDTVRANMASFDVQAKRAASAEVEADLKSRREKTIQTAKDWGC